MEAGAKTREVSIRARHARRRALSFPDIPLGVKVMAILIVLDGIGSLVGAALALFPSEEVPGQLTGPAAVAVNVIAGTFSIWLGRHLYRGSRVALDFLIGGYVVFLAYGLLQDRGASVDIWMLAVLALPGAFLVYLFWCRSVLRKLEKRQ